jgi:hypothetical protein
MFYISALTESTEEIGSCNTDIPSLDKETGAEDIDNQDSHGMIFFVYSQ